VETMARTYPAACPVFSVPESASQPVIRANIQAERNGSSMEIRPYSPASHNVPSGNLRHSRTGALAPSCSQEVLDRMLLEKAKDGNVEDIQAFVRYGANVNAVDKAGRSSRHLAAIGGHVDAMEMLLTLGANRYAQDYAGDHGIGITPDEYLTLWTRTGHRARPEHALQAYAEAPMELWDTDTAASILQQYTEAYTHSFDTEEKAQRSGDPKDADIAKEASVRLVEMRRTIKEYEASHAMMGHQGVRKIMAWEAPGWSVFEERFKTRSQHRRWAQSIVGGARNNRAWRDANSTHEHLDSHEAQTWHRAGDPGNFQMEHGTYRDRPLSDHVRFGIGGR